MIVNCLYCNTNFNKKPKSSGLYCSASCSSKYRGAKVRFDYNLSPKQCLHCNNNITYESRGNNFCGSSCAAIFNNAKKDYSSFKTGPKKGHIPICCGWNRSKEPKPEIVGSFSRIYFCKCKYTGIEWVSSIPKRIHPSAINIRKVYSYKCRFSFSIRKYKEWFDEYDSVIKQYGWYSASNRGNNISGCSRDHMYSVHDGFKNKIDPCIISHPANCRILPHRINQRKNSKSTITVEELFLKIKDFDEKYPNWRG